MVKEKEHNIGQTPRENKDKPRNSKKEDKALTKIREKGNTDEPINPHFGKGLEMVDDSLIQAIKILNNPNTNKPRTCND